MLPMTSSEPSIIQTTWDAAEEDPGLSDDHEESEHFNPTPERHLQFVTGYGPVPTNPGNIGDPTGDAAEPPNGV